MARFLKKKKPLPKSERYYEEEQENVFSKMKKFSVFVVISLVLVVLIFGTVFYFNISDNAFKKFADASVKNFDSGSFHYHISASLNGETHLDYDGQLEFELDSRSFESTYHAVYDNYEYDATVYANKADAYIGTYYGGKWSVESYIDKALDFFSFYREYRKGRFDAGAAVRFTETNDTFNAVALETAVENIYKDLAKTSSLNDILHQEVMTDENGTVITFKPELDSVFDIVLKHIGSAYTSANAYSEFKERIENSRQNLKNANAIVSYTIDNKGYLTDITLDYTVNDDHYIINATMDDFSKAQVEIPDGFFTAAGLE